MAQDHRTVPRPGLPGAAAQAGPAAEATGPDAARHRYCQGFVGSTDYIRAKKGVILTTSQYTKDARDFVSRIEGKKVALIDGPKRAGWMIEQNVGVNPTKTYELKAVSNNFFDEDEG